MTEPQSYIRLREIRLISEEIRRVTGKEAVVVSGALTAMGLAHAELADVTVGAKDIEAALAVKRLLAVNSFCRNHCPICFLPSPCRLSFV